MWDQARAILWAQWRALRNFYPRGRPSALIFTVGITAIWYGMWTVGAVFVAILLANPEEMAALRQVLPTGLMLAFLYWQVIPILMVSTGASLDLKRLLVYPIPHSQLFGLEVLLRLSTGVEMMLVLSGATLGLWLNPRIPFWAPAGFLPFVVMNLFLAAGLRNLLGRLLARRHVRELSVLLLVLAAALPQLLAITGVPRPIGMLLTSPPGRLWPWSAVARIALGEASPAPWLVLLCWMAVAYLFGRWQFERGLRFDAAETAARPTVPVRKEPWVGRLYRLPSVLFSDPLAAMVEKEIRFLSRAPRFRVVFLMGFTFGLLVWLPMAFRAGGGVRSAFTANYLTFVSVYALLLLGEVTFWNSFGFDRSAAQLYFLAPLPGRVLLAGKNIAAATFVFLEVTMVALVCFLLGMPVSVPKIAECYLVASVLTLYLLAAGNLGSAHFPRPVNPAQSWRSASAGRFQALLLLVYPVLSIPVALAYLARYAFDSSLAFYLVLAVAGVLGAVAYWIALNSSVAAIDEGREKLLEALSQGEGPISRG